MKAKGLIFFLFLLAALSACEPKTYTPEFLLDDTIRLESGKDCIFRFSPSLCQWAYNSQRLEFRAHTDTMSDYFMLKLNSRPEEEGSTVYASRIDWTEPNGMNRSKINLALQVVKLEGETIWLWDKASGLKMTIRMP